MTTPSLNDAVIGLKGLSQLTGYPYTALRTANFEKRLPVRVLLRVGPTLMLNRQDADRLARAYPARMSKELYAQLVAQQEPQALA